MTPYHVHLGGEVAGDPSDPIGESNGERIDSEEVSGEEIAWFYIGQYLI